MIIAGIVLLSIAGIILLIFIGEIIASGLSGGNSFGILASAGAKVYLPVLFVGIACAIAGILLLVLR